MPRKFPVLLIFTILTSTSAHSQLQIVTPFAGSNCGGSTFANAISANGILTCATPIGAAALSSIGAATGANTVSSGNNTGQIWNWANTTDSTSAFTFGEATAATNGTSSSGVPNQVLLKLSTLSGSTQSPLSVYQRGIHVFSISPSSAQVLAAFGSISAPSYSFANDSSVGIFRFATGTLGLSAGGGAWITLSSTQFASSGVNFLTPNGTATAPAFAFNGENSLGFYKAATGELGIAMNGENSRFTEGGWQPSVGSANATSYTINARKSRGSVSSPSVITSGDDLFAVRGYGYVGATNAYREAARIELDSTGTVSDSTTGIGGLVRIMSTLAGTDSAVQENVRFAGGSQPYSQWAGMAFADLPGAPVNGMFLYCTDCTIANPCTSGGNGAFAKRLNGVWVCN